MAMDAVELYQTMFLIRTFEESLHELFAQGKLFGTVHTCLGQEADAVAVVGAMRKEDIVFSNHRGHGHYIAKTGDLQGLMAEIMGRRSGICGGRGGSQHLCNREYNFYSNGIQGGIVPNAVGMALAEKIRGTANIVTMFLGDGTLGEGVVYESFNVASLWSLPVLFIVENNHIAQTTPSVLAVAGSIVARPHAFGIESSELEVEDPECLVTQAEEALRFVRTNTQPFALVLHTRRLGPHSKGDDSRSPQEIAAHRKRDPLLHLRAKLNSKTVERIERQCSSQIQEVIHVAENSPFPRDA
jgi:TPP-dependent pyruvate/acetoin dehydrogenase alpha subunit